MFKHLLSFILCSSCLLAEQTLSIIKPDAVKNQKIGEIETYLESAGLKIAAVKMTRLTPDQARSFYSELSSRPFFKSLVEYMTSGPILVQVLEAPDAIALNRKIMGATDPAKADPGTIRADFGTSIERNAIHGSDSEKSAQREISFFFSSEEIYSY